MTLAALRRLSGKLRPAARATWSWFVGRESAPVAMPYSVGLVCSRGLTRAQVRTLLGSEARWVAFEFWMRGQTISYCVDHGAIYPRRDVERFMKGLPVDD